MKGCIYCPKCDRSIPKEEIEKKLKDLKARFGDDSLASGKCPVCGTPMIDMDKVDAGRNRKG